MNAPGGSGCNSDYGLKLSNLSELVIQKATSTMQDAEGGRRARKNLPDKKQPRRL